MPKMYFIPRLVAGLTLLASSQAMAVLQVTLKAEALVHGPRVTLGDVAVLSDTVDADAGNGASAERALAAIELGGAPLAGYTYRYTRKEVERLVRAANAGQPLSWNGASTVRVERAAKSFDLVQIAAIARDYLCQTLRPLVVHYDVQLVETLPDLLLSEGKVELRPRAMTSEQALHKHVTIWVDVLIDGTMVRSVAVPFDVKAYAEVLVAKQELFKGTSPSCDVLQVQEVDVTALDGPAMAADCTQMAGQLKRSLTAGTPLLKAFLQAPVAVAQGDSISLQLVSGALILESRAVALVDGAVGQRISVRPSAGTDTVIAEVVAPGIVKITGK